MEILISLSLVNLIRLYVYLSESRSVMSDSLRPHALYSPWTSPGQNTGVGSLSLLQGIFPTQGWNPGLPSCRWILYQLSHKGSPGILEWIAYPFSRGSSQPRNQTGVSCMAGRSFPSLATREVTAIREMQIKITMRYHLRLVRMAIIKGSTSKKWWRQCGEKGPRLQCWRERKVVLPLWDTVWRFLKN